MSATQKLTLVGLIPCIVSILLIFFTKKKNIDYSKLSYQIIIGIIFGICSILGTELGVTIAGATLNTRDAAALCGGLIFGPVAGVIAGCLGGIERWFAVYWGAGTYTRVACTISTITIGIVGAALRKKMFHNQIPPTFSTLVIGIVTEVFHMMMVFITNMADPINAFNVVKSCSIPMVLTNSLVLTIAVFMARLIRKEYVNIGKRKFYIADIFNRQIGILIIIAFISTSLFNYTLESKLSTQNCLETLQQSQSDVINEIKANNDEELLNVCYEIYDKLGINALSVNYDVETLKELCKEYNVSVINIVNQDGLITSSSASSNLNLNIANNSQLSDFTVLLNGPKSYVQQNVQGSTSSSTFRKYAGIIISNYGFLQVGFNYESFEDSLAQACKNIARNRHVDNTGYVLILDKQLNIVSDYYGYNGINVAISGLIIPIDYQTNVVYQESIYGEQSYYMIDYYDGYYVISTITKAEVELERDLSIYLNTFMETLVFGILFVQIYFIIKRNISEKVDVVNNSLKQITSGNLDEVVNVRDSKEFISLSDGINETVNSLKFYIKEAETRMENELQYAKEIQLNSLPSIFPPFPGVIEFDIYATMNAAKEVGGDFYDFYMEGKHKVAFVVADVSGKGIPAALFMMKAKALIKTYVSIGISPADVLINANYNLCDGNEAGMFVTCFLAYLDTETGILEVANAGHNPPCIKHKDGSYEFLKVKAGFVLGGMEGMVYKDTQIQLEQGDEIFLYTDGVTEATSAQTELFGEERLIKSLNECTNFTSQQICEKVKLDVDTFVGQAPQFDDITMLSLKYEKKYEDR